MALSLALPLAAATPADKGFEHFYNLEYENAISSFRAEMAAQPMEPAGHNHLAQAILYRSLFESGILEESLISGDDPILSVIRQPKLVLSPEADREFNHAIQRAISLSEQRLKVEPGDSSAMFLLGVSHAIRANYKFLVKKAWLSALRDSNAGRRLHNKIFEQSPSNIDATMLQGLQDYAVASLPASLRFFGTIVGMHGDKERGLRTLTDVATKGSNSRIDAQILLAVLHRREKNPAQSVQLLQSLQEAFPRNYLFPLAGIYSNLDAGDNHGAWTSLARLEKMHKGGLSSVTPAKLTFARGLIQMRSGNLDAALASFNSVVHASGRYDHLPLARALVHLGYTHDLRGERKEALLAYQKAIDVAPETRYSRVSERHLNHPYKNSAGD